jgi:hypothetical protein
VAGWSERAFDVVTEITKQVLTLATGIIALTITFFKDFSAHATATARGVMACSWGMYVVSIVLGFMTLMASAGLQEQAGSDGNQPTIKARNLRLFGGAQLVSFFVAILLTVIAGAIAV